MVKYSTPYEAWFYTKTNVSHFKIFGSTCFVYIPSQQRQKLDGKSVRCVFIGYSEESKAYRCHDPLTNKLYVSRDVIFDEGEVYFKNEGEVKVMTPHIEGSIFYNNDDSLQPSTEIYMGSPLRSSPLRVSSSSPTIITHVDSQAISPFSPARKAKSLKETYETSRYVDHNFVLPSSTHVEPFSFNEACFNELWMQAMEDEIAQIQ